MYLRVFISGQSLLSCHGLYQERDEATMSQEIIVFGLYFENKACVGSMLKIGSTNWCERYKVRQ